MSRKPTFIEAERIAALSTYTGPERDDPAALDMDGIVYLPEVRKTTYAMNPAILCRALFTVSKGSLVVGADGKKRFVRQYIERTFLTRNGASIEYRGKGLGQDDLTVLLGLL